MRRAVFKLAQNFAMHKLSAMATKQFHSAVDAARELGYDRTHVTRLANAGIIKGQKIGDGKTAAWVFTTKAIEDAKKRLDKKAA